MNNNNNGTAKVAKRNNNSKDRTAKDAKDAKRNNNSSDRTAKDAKSAKVTTDRASTDQSRRGRQAIAQDASPGKTGSKDNCFLLLSPGIRDDRTV